MAKKQTTYNTKGMNRDTSVTSFNPDFCFENRNLRLATNEGNTFMSWVNEKGTDEITLKILENPWETDSSKYTYSSNINGIPIGTAIIDHKLILFTTDPLASTMSTNYRDYIYSLQYTDDKHLNMEGKILYKGNLDFQADHPLETLVYEETSEIEKVYWTDGYNQPRLINVMADSSKLKKWNSNTGVDIDTFFDFVPAINSDEKFTVTKNHSGSGLFAPGVIQYCFTYLNKHGQQSNIVAVSPIYYLAHDDRGASPKDKVSSSFTIRIENVDKNFDYIRLYSLQRTSTNDNVFAKLLDDIPLEGTTKTSLFTRELSYTNDATYILPLVDGKKVFTANVNNGDYDVQVDPIKINDKVISWEPTAKVNIVSFERTDLGYLLQNSKSVIMSLQDFINSTYYKTLGNGSEYIIDDYHVAIHISRDIDESIGASIDSLYGIEVNGEIVTLSLNDLYNDYIVYNYKDKTWYFAYSDAIDVVNKKYDEKATNYITYTDNGTTGSTIDPMELLYVGGKDISAYTMMDKDNTLFLGNIVQRNTLVTSIQKKINDDKQENPDKYKVSFLTKDSDDGKEDSVDKTLTIESTNSIYSYTNELNKNQSQITTFKGGEKYRFGFQLQKYTGEWLEPIWLEDRLNTVYPSTNFTNDNAIDTVNLVYAKGNINIKELKACIPNFDKIFRRIRPVIVFPNIGDRNVLCQGVLNPTVFNVEDRIDNIPYSQASWYFRPYMWSNSETIVNSADNEAVKHITVKRTSWIFTENTGGDKNVLIASVSSLKLASILNNKKIRIQYTKNKRDDSIGDDTINTYIDQDFYAVIPITDYSLYAFISNNNWPTTGLKSTNDGGTEEYKYTELESSTIEISRGSINLKSDQRFLYTEQQIPYIIGDNESASIEFDTGKHLYEVMFSSVGDKLSTSVNTSDNGNSVRFKHYDSLYTMSEFEDALNKKENTMYAIKDLAKNVEIEGSVKRYSTPFTSPDPTTITKGNTQFFVDQSIITLNSPDIEFDTNVQNYSMDGLKLRIIGAIPITANVSAHSIIRNSKMLERNHNGNPTKALYGMGELQLNVRNNNISVNAGKRLVSDYLWDDVHVIDDGNQKPDNIKSSSDAYDFLVYPWQRTGSLNDDTRSADVASSLLQTKQESNLLFSMQTKYLTSGVDYNHIGAQIALTENNSIINYRLPKQKATSSNINYYPNIDKVLVNGDTYKAIALHGVGDNMIGDLKDIGSPVSMKYKSTSHAVIALDANDDKPDSAIPILPYGTFNNSDTGKFVNTTNNTNTFWGDTKMMFKQESINISNLFNNTGYNFLWLGELYRDDSNRDMFGGTTETALRSNKWLIGGDAVNLKYKGTPKDNVELYWTNGDTYYQRYDCLKTYAYTKDDPNQLVEILSFMCETHVNIDGRYDRNRGQNNNLNMSPVNFNLYNPVYSQQDNFFTYRKMDSEDTDSLDYKNQIYYSKTKESGADVDMYTNVTLGSVLEMDGDKGSVNAIRRFNNSLIVFQDTGIAQILYNESTQISTQAGVPIEIANSGKVQGKRYITDTVGCSNKWAMTNTINGIYFMDNINKSIYLFNGQLQNLSITNGFNAWCKNNMPDHNTIWNPYSFDNFVVYYDKMNQDVLFINNNIALAYSEKLGAFTSFYDYGNTPYFANLDSTGIWTKYTIMEGELKNLNGESSDSKKNMIPWINESSEAKPQTGTSTNDTTDEEKQKFFITKLYSHNAGEYNKFFDEYKPYWTILVCNPEPLNSKIFTNVEFQSIIEKDGKDANNTFNFNMPFSKIEAWNDYQHGINILKSKEDKPYLHNTKDSSTVLNRKFRLWRCDIPRNNAETTEDVNLINEGYSITREKKKAIEWMRNSWIYMKLYKGFDNESLPNNKVQFHDIKLTYFV